MRSYFGSSRWALCVGMALVAAGPAAGQAYPTKPVRFVVPFAPGGSTDTLARSMGGRLSELLGQQVVVDNRPGASGDIGMQLVARSPSDGYTIVLGYIANLGIGPSLNPNMPYDPVKDFAPITQVAGASNILVIHPSLPAKNFKDFLAYVKANPKKVTFASAGVASVGHLTGELLNGMAGIDMVHVPYKGGPPAVTDTMAGHTSALFAAFPTVAPQVRAGRLRAIAVSSGKRAAMAPEVPAVAETLPGFESVQWWGMFGPAGTPAEIVDRLNTVMQKVLAMDDIRKRLAADAAEPIGGKPAEFVQFMSADHGKWGKVVKATGIRTD